MLPQPLTFCRLTLMPRANFSLNIHKPLERTCSSKHKEEEEEKVKRELLNPSFVFSCCGASWWLGRVARNARNP